MSGPATENIPFDEISFIETVIAQIYGVDVSDLNTDVDYITSGILNIVLPDDLSPDVTINALQKSISDVLDIHPNDVIISITDDGTIVYSVTEPLFETAIDLQNALSDADFALQLEEVLDESGYDISVLSNSVNEDVEVVLSTTIDTSEASISVDPEAAISGLSQAYGFTETIIEGKQLKDFSTFSILILILRYVYHFFAYLNTNSTANHFCTNFISIIYGISCFSRCHDTYIKCN